MEEVINSDRSTKSKIMNSASLKRTFEDLVSVMFWHHFCDISTERGCKFVKFSYVGTLFPEKLCFSHCLTMILFFLFKTTAEVHFCIRMSHHQWCCCCSPEGQPPLPQSLPSLPSKPKQVKLNPLIRLAIRKVLVIFTLF